MYANLSDEKAFVFSVALAEINRKIINQRLILWLLAQHKCLQWCLISQVMDFKNSMASQAASPDIGISKSHMFSWLKLCNWCCFWIIDCGVPANCWEAKQSALCLEKIERNILLILQRQLLRKCTEFKSFLLLNTWPAAQCNILINLIFLYKVHSRCSPMSKLSCI